MSAEIKRCYRFYSLTDYEKEENWLREMANRGWMLQEVKAIVYTFRQIAPQDIVFKLDFQSTEVSPDDTYMQMLADYGWTYLTSLNNYRYLYKPAERDQESNEIYTDNPSKLAMLRRIFRFRILPLLCLFLCCVLPGFVRVLDGDFDSMTMNVIWSFAMLLYCVLFVKVGTGYYRLFKKFSAE